MFEVQLAIEAVYNPGEWRLSKKVIGPRGGVKWVKIHRENATGGLLQIWLDPGEYKVTYWSNNWPYKYEFDVLDDGQIGSE